MFAELRPRYTQVDYSIYYLSGYLLRHGENGYTTDLNPLAGRLGMDTHDHTARDRSAPTFLAMFEPLTILSPRLGYWTWTAFNALALAASLWMLLGSDPGCALRSA